MKKSLHHLSAPFAVLFVLFFCFVFQVSAQVSVLTQHNDLKRTGWNNHETSLNQSNVNASSFGKLYSLQVDEQVYAQPLVVANINVGGKSRNVLYVSTVNNSLYAFDADDPSGTPLWQISLSPSGFRAIKNGDFICDWGGYGDYRSGMGIVGTPVIDPGSQTLYVVARSINLNDGTQVQYLHAIDITTGAEKANSPTLITASVAGAGNGSVNGTITFDPKLENQRPGLCLYNNVVYICWASQCDYGNYHGWVIGYNVKTMQQQYVYCDTPNGYQGGIWMSGQAPTVDDLGNIYITTGNGSVGYNGNENDPINRGESIVKFSPQTTGLQLVDFFTPYNWLQLEEGDLDYGSSGVMIIPNTNISLSGSKQSYLYAVNTTSLGKTTSNNTGAMQVMNINADFQGHNNIHGTPVYFKNNQKKEYIYVWAEDALLKQIPFVRKKQTFDTANTISGTTILPDGMPGGFMSVSSNMSKKNTGIVWATHSLSGNANGETRPGVLQAFSADDVTHELWNSQQNAARDNSTTFAKFNPPTVANGKVYLPTFSNQIIVYGLLPAGNGSTGRTAIKTIDETRMTNATIDLFPNPARNHITIGFNSNKAEPQQALIIITNSIGKVVYKQSTTVNPAANTFDVQLPSSVKSGVYLVQLITAKGAEIANKKLVVGK